MTDAYEPDDDRLTPGLEVQKPNYKPDEQLPPFLTQDSLSKSDVTAKYSGDEGTSSDFPRKLSPTSKPETAEGRLGTDLSSRSESPGYCQLRVRTSAPSGSLGRGSIKSAKDEN